MVLGPTPSLGIIIIISVTASPLVSRMPMSHAPCPTWLKSRDKNKSVVPSLQCPSKEQAFDGPVRPSPVAATFGSYPKARSYSEPCDKQHARAETFVGASEVKTDPHPKAHKTGEAVVNTKQHQTGVEDGVSPHHGRVSSEVFHRVSPW